MLKVQSDEWRALMMLSAMSDTPSDDDPLEELERYEYNLRFARRYLNRAIRRCGQIIRARREVLVADRKES